MEKEIKITIPKVDEREVTTFSSGEFGDIRKKFEKIDQILFGIMIAVVLSLVAIIVSVITLFLDQMRYNNVVYKEYSEKIQTLDFLQDVNNELFQQNKQGQELLIKQQDQTLELLNKILQNLEGKK